MFLAVERQYSRSISMQKPGEERTQDCWLDIAAGEIERTTTFEESSPLGSYIKTVYCGWLTVVPLAVNGEQYVTRVSTPEQ